MPTITLRMLWNLILKLLSAFWRLPLLVKWFDDNYLKMNADKCHLLICNHSDKLSVIIDNEIILGSKEVKLLGVTIDNKLDFGNHVAKLCSKVGLKLHASGSLIL